MPKLIYLGIFCFHSHCSLCPRPFFYYVLLLSHFFFSKFSCFSLVLPQFHLFILSSLSFLNFHLHFLNPLLSFSTPHTQHPPHWTIYQDWRLSPTSSLECLILLRSFGFLHISDVQLPLYTAWVINQYLFFFSSLVSSFKRSASEILYSAKDLWLYPLISRWGLSAIVKQTRSNF